MPSPADEVERAVHVLRSGGLVAFPTETVYGLGADAANAAAVRRVFEVKGRPTGHPLIVHLPDASALDGWMAFVPEPARLLAATFWPGPLTLLAQRAARVPDEVTGGGDIVGLRVPAHPLALDLLNAFGGGVAAPSANRFGRVSPTTAAHVRADLGDDVDLVLDGGPCPVGVESTIVDCTTDVPEVVRPGAVTVDQLEAVLGSPVAAWAGARDVRAPGTLAAHYAPDAEVTLAIDEEDAIAIASAALRGGRRPAVLAAAPIDGLPDGTRALEPAGDDENYARVLYERLRETDDIGSDLLIAIPPSGSGIGRAVRDRLLRAAASNA